MRPSEEEVIRKIVGEWMRKADQDISRGQAFTLHFPGQEVLLSFANEDISRGQAFTLHFPGQEVLLSFANGCGGTCPP